jgi:phosphatidate phosphatase APP1
MPGTLGIISDIDDTILQTKVNGLFKINMIINSVLINPFRRKSVSYAKLFLKQIIKEDQYEKPVIYISNSPWNMFRYLQDFIRHNEFPEGEIQLRDFGLQLIRKKQPTELQTKYIEIELIIKMFEKTKFIMIGDSAEDDFDIYKKISENYPYNVKQIIIINAGNKANEQRITNEILNSSQNIILLESFKELLDNPL